MSKIDLSYPDNNTSWLVRQYEIYRFQGNPIKDTFIPKPYISLIFHFKDCPVISSGTTFFPLDPFFVAPIIPKGFTLKFKENMDTLAVTCKATVFSKLFDLDMSPVQKRSIKLPKDVFFPLWKIMAELNSTEERIACFSEFINSKTELDYVPDAVDMLYNKILIKSINNPLKEIMQECYASKSTLSRKFIKRTGVSPKTLARIVRLNYLWNRIRDEKEIDYQELVFDGNYYDQSHFISDFKAILGETPTQFFYRNLDVVKIFSAKTNASN